ncbi:cytochrome P450, partial [Salmonella sp. s58078]|uniref:cytochrome P450 n=1 Tax=Salmonella sp. s58078 TaxID=3159699 RepID=UPI0039814B59
MIITWLISVAFLRKLIPTRNNETKSPPGPKRWPIIGNLNLVGSVPHLSLHELSKKYGEIMQLKFGSMPIVVASSPDMAKEFLKTYDHIWASRPVTAAGRFTSYNFSNMVWAPYGRFWHQARRIYANELLSTRQLDSYEYIRVEERNNFISLLYSLVGKPVV